MSYPHPRAFSHPISHSLSPSPAPSLSSLTQSCIASLSPLSPSRELRHLSTSLSRLHTHASSHAIDPSHHPPLYSSLSLILETAHRLTLRSHRPHLRDRKTGPILVSPSEKRVFVAQAHRVDAVVQVSEWKHGVGLVEKKGRAKRVGRLFSAGEVAPWEFSLVESPLTPLRSRKLSVSDQWQLAMWRGQRVGVRVVHAPVSEWRREGAYLWHIAKSPVVQNFLGGAWEGGRGYLIRKSCGGDSLERVVRENNLLGLVSFMTVLEKVVGALQFVTAKGGWHGDLWGGNVVLEAGGTDVFIKGGGFTVRVLGWAAWGDICKGRRNGGGFWESKEGFEGWCPPELVTADMWRRVRRGNRGKWGRRVVLGEAWETGGDEHDTPPAFRKPFSRSLEQTLPKRRITPSNPTPNSPSKRPLNHFSRPVHQSPNRAKTRSKAKSTLSADVSPITTSSGPLHTGAAKASFERLSKADVWSVACLLYYMCTGKHPPQDAWACRSGSARHFWKDVPEEYRPCVPIIEMCAKGEGDITQVKNAIDTVLQGLMFEKGVSLLQGDRDAGFALLDKSVGVALAETVNVEGGFGGVGEGKEGWVGLNDRTRKGLACLPVAIVRRVEWEAAGRSLAVVEREMKTVKLALVNERWSRGDVKDGTAAIDYLSGRAGDGIVAAKSALGWVYRWGAAGVGKDIGKAVELWEASADDAEACNGLGLVWHYGSGGEVVDGERARGYYERAVAGGYCAAAVNLGVLLHDGVGGVGKDGIGAKNYYQIGVKGGDGIAANNLGVLLWRGGVGVSVDLEGAVEMFQVAVGLGEKHHAWRNLGELLWEGGELGRAVECFAMAVARGDRGSRGVALSRLRKLVDGVGKVEGGGVEEGVLERCQRLLGAYQRGGVNVGVGTSG